MAHSKATKPQQGRDLSRVLTIGVTSAANFHPNFWKIVLPSSIINSVTVPVADEKFPIKAEYSFGFGNACCKQSRPKVKRL